MERKKLNQDIQDIDKLTSDPAVDRLLQEKRPAATGTAIAIGHPRDASLNVLAAWIPKAKADGFVLVPLTAVLQARTGSGVQQAARP